MSGIVDRAIRDGRKITIEHFTACYLENPIARRVITGRAITQGDQSIIIKETGAPKLDPELPITFVELLTTQYEPSDLPELPDIMPNGTWAKRIKKLGLRTFYETDGHTLYATLDAGRFRLTVHHKGYGSGYGGKRPVHVIGYDLYVTNSGLPKVGGVRGGLPVAAIGFANPDVAKGEHVRGFENVPPDILRHAIEILTPLFAPSPKVAIENPVLVRAKLEAFWDETECRRYRIVVAPHGASITPEAHADLSERLDHFQDLAAQLGIEKMVIVKDRDTAFRGTPTELDSLQIANTIGRAHYFIEAGYHIDGLEIYDQLPRGFDARVDAVTLISSRLKQSRSVFLVVDPVNSASLLLTQDAPVKVIKGQLEELIKTCRAKTYQMVVTGGSTTNGLKERRLKKLATSIRNHLKEGRTIRVSPENQTGPSDGKILAF